MTEKKPTRVHPYFTLLLCTFSVLMYVPHVYGGLHMLISAFQYKSIPRHDADGWILPTWEVGVWMLALANVVHQCLFYGCGVGLRCIWVGLAVVALFEEIGLRSGLVFGRYAFSPEFDERWRISQHIPLIVLALWTCLLYPSMLLGNKTISGNIFNIPSGASRRSDCTAEHKNATSRISNSVVHSALVACVLVTWFDVVSEPTAVVSGHRVWKYYATKAFLEDKPPYMPQPDWGFEKGQLLSFHSGVPMQNFFGWLLCSFVVYYLSFKVQNRAKLKYRYYNFDNTLSVSATTGEAVTGAPLAALHHAQVWNAGLFGILGPLSTVSSGSGTPYPVDPDKNTGASSVVKTEAEASVKVERVRWVRCASAFVRNIVLNMPIYAGLLGSMIFYALHPAHDAVTRWLGASYTCFIVYIMFLRSN